MNLSDELTILTGIRCAGIKSNTPGISFGSTYHPALRDAAGKVTQSARTVINAYINRKGRRNPETGALIEGRRDVIQLTGWNGRETKDGKGLADTMAKCISEGKEFSCRATLHSYLGKVFDDGKAVMKADGTGQLMTRRVGYTIEPGSLIFGADGDKILKREVAGYAGVAGFDTRPEFWNHSDPNHADRLAWKEISQWRMAQVFSPAIPTYGYAIIAVPFTNEVAGGGVLDHGAVKAAVGNVALPAAAGGVKLPEGSVVTEQPVLAKKVF
jgi:hypothetical protein